MSSITDRKQFDNWWEEFQSAHEELRYADREAILFAAWQAGQEAKKFLGAGEHLDQQSEIAELKTFLQALEARYRKKVDDSAELEVQMHRQAETLKAENERLRVVESLMKETLQMIDECGWYFTPTLAGEEVIRRLREALDTSSL